MTRILRFLLALVALAAPAVHAQEAPAKAQDDKAQPWWDRDWAPCEKMWDWAAYQCRNVKLAWHYGTPTLYLSGYAYHLRGGWTEEKLETFQELAWGGGYGVSRTNDEGDSFGWYGLIFRDSHNQYTKMFGYGAMTYWPKQADYALGFGYTLFIASRPDIFNNIPFPGILPLASIKLNRAELFGTFIPNLGGGINHGNVAYFFARYQF